jgi:hypothetical protein
VWRHFSLWHAPRSHWTTPLAEIRGYAWLRKPQSHVVRDAVADYAARADRLSEAERNQLLGVLEQLRQARPTRAIAEVDQELAAIRAARRRGGRRRKPA